MLNGDKTNILPIANYNLFSLLNTILKFLKNKKKC